MRAIEEVYENMSRKRIHHKVSKRKDVPPDKDAPMGTDGADGTDDNEGEGEDGAPMAATGTDGAAILAGDVLSGNDDDSEGDDNEEYLPDSGDSYSSGISDSDNLDSDENGGGYESYELGGL